MKMIRNGAVKGTQQEPEASPDRRIGREAVLFRCPECGVTQILANSLARDRYELLGSCQGCLAGYTLQRSPHLLPSFVSFWRAAGFPASPSWLERVEAVPAVPC